MVGCSGCAGVHRDQLVAPSCLHRKTATRMNTNVANAGTAEYNTLLMQSPQLVQTKILRFEAHVKCRIQDSNRSKLSFVVDGPCLIAGLLGTVQILFTSLEI